ncbi:MAG: cell division protein FtsQ/DivIB [Armatimonadota bacterium]
MSKRESRVNESRSRKNRRGKSNARRIIMTVLVLCLLVEIVVVALTSPYFNIKNITITGNITIPENSIIDVAAIPSDTNIFRLQTERIVDDLLINPVIKRAKLHRKLPDGLIIALNEREADCLLRLPEKIYEIDVAGIPFRLPLKVDENIPMITYDLQEKILLGRQIIDEIFTASRKCIEISRINCPFRIKSITVDQNGDICLNSNDGFDVIIGRPVDLNHKMDIASQVIIQIPLFRTTGEYIDVTCPEAPAVKYKNK